MALVNRDREAHGLRPVAWDTTAAAAAQRHVDDLAQGGFTAHWGRDGSVPEQRYTEAGGEDFVRENAACFSDGQERPLDLEPTFSAEALERLERAFMDEVPPNDGHRQNILAAEHTHLGLALAQPQGVSQPCLVQEFVDDLGDHDGLPRAVRAGEPLRIAGVVRPPLRFGAVGVGKLERAMPATAAQLNRTGSYSIPAPARLHVPAGYVGPKPSVTTDGQRYEVVVPAPQGQPGDRLTVSLWAAPQGSQNLRMVSLRTVLLK